MLTYENLNTRRERLMKKVYKGYIFIVLTALFFSTQEIAGKILSSKNKVDPYQVMFLAFLIGAVTLLPFAINDLKKKNIKLKLNDYLYFLFTGTLCVPLAMTALQVAVVYTKASTAAVIISSNAIFTIPFAYLILKEKLNKGTVLSLIFSLIGIGFIFNPAQLVSGFAGNDMKGMSIALFAAVTFALYNVFTTKRIQKYGGYIFNCFSFLFGDLVLFIFLLITHKPVISGITTANIIPLLYMGIFVKGVGYIFYLGAMKETSAVVASTAFLIKPALAPLIALLILQESIKSNVIVGIVFIIVGSYVNFRYKMNADKVSLKNNESAKAVE